jgi:hypothetical protein
MAARTKSTVKQNKDKPSSEYGVGEQKSLGMHELSRQRSKCDPMGEYYNSTFIK